MIIGIDGGLNGGITVIDKDKNIIFKTVMPVIGTTQKEYDMISIYNILNQYKDYMVVLEKSQPHFRDGKKQAFKTGYGYGMLQGIITALEMSYVIVSPKEWQTVIFKGLKTKDTKTASVMYCKRRWPKEDWTATVRSVKEHDGMTDSACIAVYGERL